MPVQFDFARVGFEAYNAARQRRDRAQQEARIVRYQQEQMRLAEERLRLSQMAEERIRTNQLRDQTRQILQDARDRQKRREDKAFKEREFVEKQKQNEALRGYYKNIGSRSGSTADPALARNRRVDQLQDLEDEAASLALAQGIRGRVDTEQIEDVEKRRFRPDKTFMRPATKEDIEARLDTAERKAYFAYAGIDDVELKKRIADRKTMIAELRKELGLDEEQATPPAPQISLEDARAEKQRRLNASLSAAPDTFSFDASEALRRIRNQ